MEKLVTEFGPIKMTRKNGLWTVGNWQFVATGINLDEALHDFVNMKTNHESKQSFD